MRQSKPHDFYERLAWSQQASDEPFWLAVYERAFPTMIEAKLETGNTQAQRNGIDRWITLANGEVLRVDEKKREKVYQDVLLEYLSNDKTNAPGWIKKPLTIDYLAYAFMPVQTVYLFPWLMLQRSWQLFGDFWLHDYPHISARNRGYKTHSVAVPIQVLRKAVSHAAVISVKIDHGTP